MELIEKFKNLPDELIHIIINYTDVVVYRHGKYINRIKKNDYRYNLLRSVSRPIYIGQYRVKIRLMSCNLIGYFIEYNTKKNLTEMNVRFFHREIDGFDRYFDIKSNNTYIFDVNNKLSKIIHYLM
jgi:hypothetical protein